MYVSENSLYRKVKKKGTLIYLESYYEHCDVFILHVQDCVSCGIKRMCSV